MLDKLIQKIKSTMIGTIVASYDNKNLTCTIIPNCGHIPNKNGMDIIENACIKLQQYST